MYRKVVALLIILTGISATCFAQLYPTQYRPPNQNWQYLQTPHFKVVFAEGNDSSAYQAARLLEAHYRPVQELVGGELTNFPVVLNRYNDRSNGFVTSTHFRSEIELPPIIGKSQNPQTGNWLETVVPHELVHALQLSNIGKNNLPWLVSFLSPDFARSFHGAIPSGITEGIAVYHETEHVAPNGGRGNYPEFTNQFNAVFKSNGRWSMGQMVQRSSESRPFDRHYIGGYKFTAWLQDKFGPETTRESLDFYMDFPFFGYGVALRHATGLWPNELYDQFEKEMNDSLDMGDTSTTGEELSIPYNGREIHRPKWLSDTTLIFFGSYYNARPGFFTYDLTTDELDRIITTSTVQDYWYDLTENRTEMVYSYYEADAKYDNTSKAELVRYSFSDSQKEQITEKGRVYAPVFSGDGMLALHTKPVSSSLVKINTNSPVSIDKIVSLGDHEVVSAAPNPANSQLAVVVNKRGLQGLWFSNRTNLSDELAGPPDISFDQGSVFDPEWHPSGNKIMFSSDFSGTNQLYEYDLQTQSLNQITETAFNAFEGSYSPDAGKIAFIKQDRNERLPVILNRDQFLNKEIPESRWRIDETKETFMHRPVVSDSMIAESKSWDSDEYVSQRGWLKPRTILPVFEEISNQDTYQFGLSLHSNNLLANQSYSADVTYTEGRHWYDLTYLNKLFYPGFKLRFYSQPSYVSITERVLDRRETHTLLSQNKSFAVSSPIRLRLNQNVYFTSLFVEPEIRRTQRRFFELDNNSDTEFSNIFSTNLYSQFNYRLQQNIRDLQPNSGLILFSEVEQYLNSASVNFNTIDINRTIDFDQSSGWRGGIFGFLSPFRRWNQSLRIGLRGLTQTEPVFDNQSLVSNGFSEPILPGSNNLLSFDTRYTVPIIYPDDGGFLIPAYLSNIYLVAFSNTVTDPTFPDLMEGSRSVFGLVIRTQFRLSNFTLDLGVGIGYEPSRNNFNVFWGNF